MNLDESGLSLDGNHSKTDERSSIRFGPATKVLPQGADRTNKSSVRITIIAGGTAAGYPLPPHFQPKLVAEMTTSVFKLHSSKASQTSRVFTTLLELVLTAHVASIAMQPLVWIRKNFASTLRIQFVHYTPLLVINQESVCF